MQDAGAIIGQSELGVVPTTEKDREEFAAKDSDLKSIDSA
jgi:hypothetical protein